MIILGIETSCDETSAAVLTNSNNRIIILSNIVASSAKLQSKFGGIIPELAAREQIKCIIPVLEEALSKAKVTPTKLDAIAITYGPGLIGSLLVGVEAAKVFARIWKKPLIPINHLLGHFYANWINDNPLFPAIGLLVSGGHTDLVYFTNHNIYKYLGGTRDDASGECFDKCARLLNLPYPGGPQISNLAKLGQSSSYILPRPMIISKNYDFSFSGLKTAVSNLVKNEESKPSSKNWQYNIAASLEQAIIDVLVAKTIRAAKAYKVKQIMIAGGVSANQKLVSELKIRVNKENLIVKLHIPSINLCTDNAAMIAAAGFFVKALKNPFKLQADPNLSLA